jgi:hypothetical protein
LLGFAILLKKLTSLNEIIYKTNMSIEYKIMNTNKNINLTDDEIKLSKIKSKCGSGGEKPTKSKAPV